MTLVVALVACTRGDPAGGVDSGASREVDRDRDGFAEAADCDDADADRHLGASDAEGDGVDGDCDGADGSGTSVATLVSAGPVGDELARPLLRYGNSLALGDFDAGAGSEVVVGSYDLGIDPFGNTHVDDGGLWLLDGSLRVVVHVRGDTLESSVSLGTLVLAGDVVGGPADDLVTGASRGVLVGEDGMAEDPNRMTLLVGTSDHSAAIGRLSNDDRSDLIVVRHPDEGPYEATVDLWFGPMADTSAGPDHVVDTVECVTENVVGCDDVSGDDWSGDGVGDLLVSLSNRDDFRGRLLGLQGPFGPGASALADATWVVDGDGPGDWFGEEVGPTADLDGDGRSEVLVAALGWPGEGERGGTRHGRVFAVPGGGTQADAPWWVESDSGEPELLGRAIGVGDLDGDGALDVAIGAPGNSRSADDWLPGRVLVFFGPLTGPLRGSDADVVFVGDQPGSGAGWALAVGDVTGDGVDDLVIGAPYRDSEAATDNGAVFLAAGPLR